MRILTIEKLLFCLAAQAGLRSVQLVQDTSAAAAAYAHSRLVKKNVVVVDIGGGGSNACVANIDNHEVKVLIASRERLPGGNDFTERLFQHVMMVIIVFKHKWTSPILCVFNYHGCDFTSVLNLL